MSLNDILVCLDPSPAADQRLELASRLARTNGARLTGVYPLYESATAISFAIPADRLAATAAGAGVALTGLAAPELAALQGEPIDRMPTDAAAERFNERLRTGGLEGDWHVVSGADSTELIDLARLADLAVLGQIDRDAAKTAVFSPGEIALGCGTPVLVVPYAGTFATIGARVVVAWDSTREATRALHDALPLMSGAEAVLVLTVTPYDSDLGPARVSLERVARHLAHHGIAATGEATLRGDLGVSDVLLARAADFGADLLVAGAYHHSRSREALFGGVTYDLLDHMTMPVLMSH